MKISDNMQIIIGVAGLGIAYLALGGKAGEGGESGGGGGGLDIPFLGGMLSGSGGGSVAPGTDTGTIPFSQKIADAMFAASQPIAGINPTYSATASGNVYQAQAKVDPTLANIFQAQTPLQIQDIQKKASTPSAFGGSYSGGGKTAVTTSNAPKAGSLASGAGATSYSTMSKKAGAPTIKTSFSSTRAW